MDEVRTLAVAPGGDGSTVLRVRRRGTDQVEELVVNGVFAMDSSETASERELAALAVVPGRTTRVLVGGLGLGYTPAAVLPALAASGRLDVVELEPALVEWARAGLTPVLAQVSTDPRVRLHVADVAAVLTGRVAEPPGPWDAILLDVDNGPDFLIHAHNARLYDEATMAVAAGRLSPSGVLAVWCQGPSPALLATLAGIGEVREHRYQVAREGRDLEYAIYTLRARRRTREQ